MSEVPQNNERETPPVIEREDLIKKLEKIPTEVLRSILTNQVDLEIRLKHKELALTEEEIGKCEAQMLALRKFLEVPNEISFRNEPSDFTLKYYSILNESLSVNFTRLQQQQYHQQPVLKESIFEENMNTRDSFGHPSVAHTYRTRSTTSSLRPSIAGSPSAISGCLYRRTDGVVVKLTCPDCHRSNFSSAQGFLNHNRIAHSKEFTSQDAAALKCGEALAEEFQDEEGLMSILMLRRRGLDASNNLNDSGFQYDAKPDMRPEPRGSHERRDFGRKGSGHERKGSERKGSIQEKNHEKLRKRDDEVGSQELMKKLIDNGITQDAEEYQAMVHELRSEIPNAHLFEGEKEDEELSSAATRTRAESNEVQTRANEVQTRANEVQTRANEVQTRENEVQTRANVQTIAAQTRISTSRSTQGETDMESVSIQNEPKYRADAGGKYENRLRRRKSRSDIKDDEDEKKRRK